MRIEYYVEFRERSSHTGGIEKFEDERENFIVNAFIYFRPAMRVRTGRTGSARRGG